MADIEKIKSNVDEIKKSVSDLKSEIETFDKEKNTLQKNIIDQKQQEIDNKKNEIEKKKKETQDLIEKARNEYINLKLDDLDEATKKTVQEEKTKNEALLNEYEKELKAIETDKKSFWEKVKD
jgi:chromosome segregation ATPase